MIMEIFLAFQMLHNKKASANHLQKLSCDRDRIQTCNRLIRSQLLYSVELRGHAFFV